MANESMGQESVPQQFANVPPDLSPTTGHLRLIVSAVEASVKDLKGDLRDVKNNRHSDFVYLISVFAGGFLLLAGMFIFGYLKIADKIDAQTISNAKIETKLDDLVARIPPVQSAPKR